MLYKICCVDAACDILLPDTSLGHILESAEISYCGEPRNIPCNWYLVFSCILSQCREAFFLYQEGFPDTRRGTAGFTTTKSKTAHVYSPFQGISKMQASHDRSSCSGSNSIP